MKWEKVKLGDVCDITSGGTPNRKKIEYYDSGTIPWVKTGDLKNKYIAKPQESITELGLLNSSAKLFPEKTVLIALYGATIGNCSILKSDAATNQACGALLPSQKIIPEFLYYFLCSHKQVFISQGVGGAQPNISGMILKTTKIPLPPLEEQKKIAAALEKADSLRQIRKQQLEKLDELTQSLFYDMFGDPVTNPKGWEKGKIGDLAVKTQYGTSKKADEKKGDYPVLRMNNITYLGGWDFSSLKYVDLDEKELVKYLVYKNEILFNRTNSKELVGKTAVYRNEQPMAFAGYLVKLIANEKANPEYISAYLNSKHGKTVLLNKAKNIVGMANINAEELKKIKINIPPLELQNQFAERVEKIEEQKKQLEESLKELDNNFNSLSQRAFKGELKLVRD